MGIWAHEKGGLDANMVTDEKLESVRTTFQRSGVYLSVVGSTINHIASDPAQRKHVNDYFVKVIEMAGKVGAPYVGTASGTMRGHSLKEQVAEIVRVYEKVYFPVCQKSKVRIFWEPWPDGPNMATGPQGYDALFTAFGNSPYVGLQYDPSHLVRLFMDPIQTARDYGDKIYDVHLKDTEIDWPMLRKVGIRAFDDRGLVALPNSRQRLHRLAGVLHRARRPQLHGRDEHRARGRSLRRHAAHPGIHGRLQERLPRRSPLSAELRPGLSAAANVSKIAFHERTDVIAVNKLERRFAHGVVPARQHHHAMIQLRAPECDLPRLSKIPAETWCRTSCR